MKSWVWSLAVAIFLLLEKLMKMRCSGHSFAMLTGGQMARTLTNKGKQTDCVASHQSREKWWQAISMHIDATASHTALSLIEWSHNGKRQATFHVRPSISAADCSSLSFVWVSISRGSLGWKMNFRRYFFCHKVQSICTVGPISYLKPQQNILKVNFPAIHNSVVSFEFRVSFQYTNVHA